VSSAAVQSASTATTDSVSPGDLLRAAASSFAGRAITRRCIYCVGNRFAALREPVTAPAQPGALDRRIAAALAEERQVSGRLGAHAPVPVCGRVEPVAVWVLQGSV
jgi:hypothetical protein